MANVVLVNKTEDTEYAHSLATNLAINQYDTASGHAEFILWLLPAGLSLQPNDPSPPSPLRAEFVSGKAAHRRNQGEMIVKAAKVKGMPHPHVLDSTAGLGRDAFVLASHGFEMTLLERNPIIHALLNDAMRRARLDSNTQEATMRMQLYCADALQWLPPLSKEALPDVILLDPMFPARQKPAAVKKEMLILQRLLGPSDDNDALLQLSLEKARYKVVVKRPLKSPPLGGRRPSYDIRGKSTRFDVYSTHSHA